MTDRPRQHTVTLLLGSNHPDCERLLAHGTATLVGEMDEAVVSSVVQSADAEGGRTVYINQVVRGVVSLDYEEMLALTKRIERDCGRTSESKIIGSIELDIDIMEWDGSDLRPEESCRYYYKACLDTIERRR